LYEDVTQLPSLTFDFIVVGGAFLINEFKRLGLSPLLQEELLALIANRLTENPRFSVLVLEAGGS